MSPGSTANGLTDDGSLELELVLLEAVLVERSIIQHFLRLDLGGAGA
jgi:hypothetical protein